MTAEKPIRLVLAGNNAIVLACLERLFALEENFAVVAHCGKGENVPGTLRAYRPDILLLDLPPSFREGLAVLREMKEAALPTRAIFLAETLAEDEMAAAVRLGVAGIVPKDVAPDLLAQCIRNVHAGGVWLRGTAAFPKTGRPTATGSAHSRLGRSKLSGSSAEVLATGRSRNSSASARPRSRHTCTRSTRN